MQIATGSRALASQAFAVDRITLARLLAEDVATTPAAPATDFEFRNIGAPIPDLVIGPLT